MATVKASKPASKAKAKDQSPAKSKSMSAKPAKPAPVVYTDWAAI